MTKKQAEIRRQTIIKRINNGDAIEDIAKYYKMNCSYIKTIYRQEYPGAKFKKTYSRKHQKKAVTDERCRNAFNLRIQGIHYAEIAEQEGVSRQCIQQRVQRYIDAKYNPDYKSAPRTYLVKENTTNADGQTDT